MPRLELTIEQVIELVKQLPPEEKESVLAALYADLQPSIDPETQEWLEADLSGELPPYEWAAAGVPHGQPVKFTPSQGFVIERTSKVRR